jgi:hypothetical protein
MKTHTKMMGGKGHASQHCEGRCGDIFEGVGVSGMYGKYQEVAEAKTLF